MKQIFYVSTIVLIILHYVVAQETETTTISNADALIKEIFTPVTEDPDSCQCVPLNRCKNSTTDDSESTDGVNVIDIRLGGVCNNYLEVCCKPSDLISKEEKKDTVQPVFNKSCGFRNENGIKIRITGDVNNEAQYAEFPWMVAILNKNLLYLCGGSLIHPNVVLTAAHCVNNQSYENLIARAGEWDVKNDNEIYPNQDRGVAEIIYHENYKSGSLHNDFALLRLDQPFNNAENVGLICLPDSNINFDTQRCYASGWGKTSYNDASAFQVILKKIELPIVSHDDCQKSLRTTRLRGRFLLDQSFICAGGEEGKDTCKGDGGGPLVCPIQNDPQRYYQVGIVSWGIGCGENQIPGVYANVPYARSWIDQKMTLWNLDTNLYQYNNLNA